MANIDNKNVRKIVLNKYGGKCAYCGCDLLDKLTIDHIVPKRRHDEKHPCKGKDIIDNYNPACYSCNSSKGTFTLNQWRDQLELQHDRCIMDSATFRSLLRFGQVEIIKRKVTFYFEKIKDLNYD